MIRQPCVYIMASKRNGTLYAGVTSDLVKRVWEHKTGVIKGFPLRYHVHRLVWFETHGTDDDVKIIRSTFRVEPKMRNWPRAGSV